MGTYLFIAAFDEQLVPEYTQVRFTNIKRGKARQYALYEFVYARFERFGINLHFDVTNIPDRHVFTARSLPRSNQNMHAVASERNIRPSETATNAGHNMGKAPIN